MPDTPVVNTSAMCTLALATAGVEPVAIRKLLDVMPYAMPSAPSTVWASRPSRLSSPKVRNIWLWLSPSGPRWR